MTAPGLGDRVYVDVSIFHSHGIVVDHDKRKRSTVKVVLDDPPHPWTNARLGMWFDADEYRAEP